MTTNKVYNSIAIYSQGGNVSSLSEAAEIELDKVVLNDKNGYGINLFGFHIRSENGEKWEELFFYDNKNGSSDFSRRAKEILSAETIRRISNFGKEVSRPLGIPYSVRQEFSFAFREAKRRMENLKYSPTEGDANYICREEGFEIPYFDGTLHFLKKEFNEEYHDEEYRDMFPKYSPYFILLNGVHVFYPEQVFAFDENRWLIDWPE